MVGFRGGPGTAALMEAVEILKELNRQGGRKVPEDAPASFVPARYAEYLEKARTGGDDTAYRHYWELCVILALRDGLRSGDVFVPGSRRYADPATYLYTPQQWAPKRAGFCQLTGKPASAAAALAQGKEELHAALAELDKTLADAPPGDAGAVRLDADGKLVIPPLTAEDVPAEAAGLRAGLAGMLPFAPIASLLVELDVRTGFLGCFTHAGGRKQARSADLKAWTDHPAEIQRLASRRDNGGPDGAGSGHSVSGGSLGRECLVLFPARRRRWRLSPWT